MIRAVGIDIVEIARIESAMRRPRFVERILTERERQLCTTPRRVAGRWAAKEAAMKCLAVPATFRQIEILSGDGGEPLIRVESGLAPPGARWHVSLTHERHYAAAIVVLELE